MVQEVFEVLYHMLWETVHVYFEHREQGHDIGASSFLSIPFGEGEQRLEEVVREVRGPTLRKMHETSRLRSAAAESGASTISGVATAIRERPERG